MDTDIRSRTSNTLHLISHMIDDLDGLLGDLNDLRTEVENFKSQIALHVAVDAGRAIGLQYWNVTILYFVSPLALSGTIMQAGIGFDPPVLCFIVLALGLAFLTWALKPLLRLFGVKRLLHKIPFRKLWTVFSRLQVRKKNRKSSFELPTRSGTSPAREFEAGNGG
ncbi:hypothetical protein LX32DRAFT_263655 [Colletotrichum zoysiae]|uniref:Uncharacterized protein n=1 Tax=Colletotrichum zoysiae TaxID=1216348 RepID=A0AAD9LUT9_9PEZI|nr:hypothetical protein LX32DRAFT_263655 [Colletotrichum zoysiae]